MSRLKRLLTAPALLAVPVLCLVVARSLTADSTPISTERPNSSNAVALSAFRDVASVLASPRCLNCHIAGQSPLQGDDSRPHSMNVKRGADGRGSPAMRCTNCHQSTNSELAHAPPGAPDWRLPEAKTPLAWQPGRTKPPLSHQQFVDKFTEWTDSGAPCQP